MIQQGHSIILNAGKLHMLFENGFLRYVRLGREEFVRMIYFAVRDANWGTVPYRIEGISTQVDDKAFEISYEAICQQGEIDFRWKCNIVGKENRIFFSIAGRSHSNFYANRIGFCLLHPIRNHAGLPIEIEHSIGRTNSYSFPENVSPHQPFTDISKMEWELESGSAFLDFKGAGFETEDQRNWLDASYKTYCTPLELPFPVLVRPQDEVSQSILLKVEPKPSFKKHGFSNKHFLSISDNHSPLPAIGLESNKDALNPWTINRLKALKLSHVRVELKFDLESWQTDLKLRCAQANMLGVPISLLVFANENRTLLSERLSQIAWSTFDICEVTVIDSQNKSAGEAFLASVLPVVKSFFPNIPLGSGTDFYFAEFNRQAPPMDELDFCSFSANPQVHAFDNRSIMETASSFEDVTKSAKILSGGKPVHISPITLKPRSNPDATEELSSERQIQIRVDERQKGSLCAHWTLASIKYLSTAGAASASFFQTTGNEGLLRQEEKRVFPVFKIFEFLGRYKGGHLIHSFSSSPLEFEGLVLRYKEKIYAVLANFTAEPITINFQDKSITLKARELKFLE
ncbi:hypothetical protein [Poritiphilus flavus]|uniref:Uncharacterized protein n=1 Tax=Poritiphilus flavus TaxID=2697053 RepID=A0A6L9E7K1_9FLAO|nr:hypothetical protein [Poritiphilus flavus]NAS10624.1 hypothetical protein [Poritiphilus flavus]